MSPIQLQLSNVVRDVRVRPDELEEVWDAIPAVIALGTVLEGLYIHCTVEQGLGYRSPSATDQRTGCGGRLVVLERFKDSAFEFRRKLRQCARKDVGPIYICLMRERHSCEDVVGSRHRRGDDWGSGVVWQSPIRYSSSCSQKKRRYGSALTKRLKKGSERESVLDRRMMVAGSSENGIVLTGWFKLRYLGVDRSRGVRASVLLRRTLTHIYDPAHSANCTLKKPCRCCRVTDNSHPPSGPPMGPSQPTT